MLGKYIILMHGVFLINKESSSVAKLELLSFSSESLDLGKLQRGLGRFAPEQCLTGYRRQ